MRIHMIVHVWMYWRNIHKNVINVLCKQYILIYAMHFYAMYRTYLLSHCDLDVSATLPVPLGILVWKRSIDTGPVAPCRDTLKLQAGARPPRDPLQPVAEFPGTQRTLVKLCWHVQGLGGYELFRESYTCILYIYNYIVLQFLYHTLVTNQALPSSKGNWLSCWAPQR